MFTQTSTDRWLQLIYRVTQDSRISRAKAPPPVCRITGKTVDRVIHAYLTPFIHTIVDQDIIFQTLGKPIETIPSDDPRVFPFAVKPRISEYISSISIHFAILNKHPYPISQDGRRQRVGNR
jgi:hypothetical protein